MKELSEKLEHVVQSAEAILTKVPYADTTTPVRKAAGRENK
jgi:hypothetical protein